jgi:hypothetical protein
VKKKDQQAQILFTTTLLLLVHGESTSGRRKGTGRQAVFLFFFFFITFQFCLLLGRISACGVFSLVMNSFYLTFSFDQASLNKRSDDEYLPTYS